MHAQVHTKNLSFSHGAEPLLAGVTVTVGPGARVGLVGPNGAGKSTLLALLAGELEPAEGSVSSTPSSATVGLMRQDRAGLPGETVAELIARQTGVAAAVAELGAATAAVAVDAVAAADRYDTALDRWLRLGAADLDSRIEEIVAPLLGSGAADRVVASLSGGERAKVWLAAVTLSNFDVLLLDEPTNDLDIDGLARIESLVLGRGGPTVIVSHDRRFLEAVVTEVLEIGSDPRVQQTVTRFGGTWVEYLEAREVAKRHAEERFEKYETDRGRLESRARTQRGWATTGVAKETRNPKDNDKAQRDFRINRTEKLASKARQTEKALDRLDVVDKPWQPWELQFTIGEAERSGDLVASLGGAVFGRGAFEMGPIDFTLDAGDRLLIEGSNGSGKTTFVNALLGRLELRAGEQRLGRSVIVGELDQGRAQLHGDQSLVDSFVDATGVLVAEARSTLAKFGLFASHIDRPTADLSPGEQTRAVLASFQAAGVNTLILDEPTNHLDLPAIEQLEQALTKFAGTLVVISHDRALIQNLTISRHLTLPIHAP